MLADNNFNEKKNIRVLVVMGSKDSYFNTNHITALDGDDILKGFNWDIWREIQQKLSDKYNFQITESNVTKDYDSFVKLVEEGKYDIAISGFTHLSTRQNVKFCIPHAITSNAVLYKNKPEIISDFKYVSGTLLKVLMYLVIIGLLIGVILYFFSPNRRNHSKRLQKNNSLFFMRSIVTGVASIFGEMGYLAERSSLKPSGMIITILMMSICFILIMYFQAEITKILLTNESTSINHYNVSKLKLIGHANNSDVLKIQRYGTNIKKMKNKTTNDLVEYYLENTNKFDGVIMPYHEAFSYVQKDSSLKYSADFGNEPCSFIVNSNPSLNQFFNDVNKEIAHLREEKRIQKICVSYFGDIQHIPMCSLA